MIELEYFTSSGKLLSSIKRSYRHITYDPASPIIETRLFHFERISKDSVKLRFIPNILSKVTVKSTGEVYVVTQRISFGDDDWTLYKIKGEKYID